MSEDIIRIDGKEYEQTCHGLPGCAHSCIAIQPKKIPTGMNELDKVTLLVNDTDTELCPKCDGTMYFDEDYQVYRCEYCNAEFEIDEVTEGWK